MNNRTIGWVYVAIQAIVIAVVVLLPGRDDWPTPSWVVLAGGAVVLLGFALMAVAALNLGTTLTPTPVPKESGTLRTDGFYQYVRHPIYVGVITCLAGVTIRSGSLITLTAAIVAVGFFNAKAQWEEAQLAKKYPEYVDYRASTPRFVPRIPRR